MDAVVLANYAHEHAPFAIRCLNEGKHVLSEVLPCTFKDKAGDMYVMPYSKGEIEIPDSVYEELKKKIDK